MLFKGYERLLYLFKKSVFLQHIIMESLEEENIIKDIV